MSSSSTPIRRLLASRISSLKESPTVALNDLSNQLIKQNKKVYKFSIGQSPFPIPSCIVTALRNAAAQKNYLPAQGLLPLRETIATYHNEKNKRHFPTEQKVTYSANDVMIGPGTKELSFYLQLAYYGELVLHSPCWLSYIPQAKMLGRPIHIIRSKMKNSWKITPKYLQQYLELEGKDKPRILILNYPSNPTGVTYTSSELEALAAVLREYGVIVLSDEIYSSFTFNEAYGGYTTISQYYPEGTIILDGMSKCVGAGGYRLGYFVFPPNLQWLLQALKNCASETFTSVSAPIQHAAITAYDGHFENEEIKEYLERGKEVLRHVSTMCVDGLRSYNMEVVQPDGGFYVFPKFDETKKGQQLKAEIHDQDEQNTQIIVDRFFQRVLNESGAAVIPGHYFGTRASSLFFRLSYVDFDGEQALKNPSNKKLYDQILFGVESIGQYLNS